MNFPFALFQTPLIIYLFHFLIEYAELVFMVSARGKLLLKGPIQGNAECVFPFSPSASLELKFLLSSQLIRKAALPAQTHIQAFPFLYISLLFCEFLLR